jgi:hypothetical protein
VLFVLALVLMSTATASARDFEVHEDGFQAEMRLEGSNGYDITVSALGHEHVALAASKGGVSATYIAPARASRKGIEADLGPFGRISVRFDATARRPTRKSDQCKGPRAIEKVGTFRGTVSFSGEHGFTEVEARRARGVFRRSFRQVCEKAGRPERPPRRSGGGEISFTTLTTKGKLGGRALEFGYLEFGIDLGPNRPALQLLSIGVGLYRERVGKVLVTKGAIAPGTDRSLRVSEAGVVPETATIYLPKPFSGKATYSKTAGSPPAWAGSLAVRLPGSGTVPMVGEGFKASLCQASGFQRIEACLSRWGSDGADPPKTAAFLLAQGSGSQSQVFWDDRLSWSR